MSAPFNLDKEALRQAAFDLRQALVDVRKRFEEEGYPGSVELVDVALKQLDPVLDLCVARELEEPFDFIGYMGRLMGDDLGFPEITKPYYRLCDLARGGLTYDEFWKTDHYRKHLLPHQLRRPPEYTPSPEEQERINRDLTFKNGG